MIVNQLYVDLLQKKEKLENQIEILDHELDKMNKQWIIVNKKFENGGYSKEKLDELKEKFLTKVNKISELKKKTNISIKKINKKLDEMKNSIYEVVEGNNIDLVRECSCIDKYNYKIRLKDTGVIIGNIEYRIKEDKLHVGWTGNVGYRVEKEYRGQGYASEALGLLINKLKEDDISHIYIALKNDNVSSMRVAQKNGAKLMEEFSDNNYSLYRCDLKEMKKVAKR